jgi:hypothetical protein
MSDLAQLHLEIQAICDIVGFALAIIFLIILAIWYFIH